MPLNHKLSLWHWLHPQSPSISLAKNLKSYCYAVVLGTVIFPSTLEDNPVSSQIFCVSISNICQAFSNKVILKMWISLTLVRNDCSVLPLQLKLLLRSKQDMWFSLHPDEFHWLIVSPIFMLYCTCSKNWTNTDFWWFPSPAPPNIAIK